MRIATTASVTQNANDRPIRSQGIVVSPAVPNPDAKAGSAINPGIREICNTRRGIVFSVADFRHADGEFVIDCDNLPARDYPAVHADVCGFGNFAVDG